MSLLTVTLMLAARTTFTNLPVIQALIVILLKCNDYVCFSASFDSVHYVGQIHFVNVSDSTYLHDHPLQLL